MVVSHAGAGSIFESVRARRRLLVVVNPELMDNHQVELAEAMAERGHLSWTLPGGVVESLRALPETFMPLEDPKAALDAAAGVIAAELGLSGVARDAPAPAAAAAAASESRKHR